MYHVCIGPVSKYLGTRSLAGLGATSGQSLPRTCKFRSESIDLLYTTRYFFFLFEALRLDLETCSKHQDFFWFSEKLPWCIICFFFFFLWSKRLFAELGWPWRPTPTERKVNVTFVWCFHSLRQRLGSFLLWKSVERQYFFKEDI